MRLINLLKIGVNKKFYAIKFLSIDGVKHAKLDLIRECLLLGGIVYPKKNMEI